MSKHLLPREALMGAIERQQDHIERLRTDHAAGRATKAQLDEAVSHCHELWRKALLPATSRPIASFANGVLTEYAPLPEAFAATASHRRSAPLTTQKPATASTASHRARLSNTTKELHLWRLRRAAQAAHDLADAQERMSAPRELKQATARPTNPQALAISIGLKLRQMARTLNDRN